MDVRPKPFAIKATIKTIMERLEPIVKEKRIKMNQKLPHDLLHIDSDENRVHQILQNLIGNAVKFTQEGVVNVSARTDEENIHVEISDTGIGISGKDLPHIFDEFRQVDGTSSRLYEGTGLGLSIAYKTARMLGGDISVKSTLGKGSTFILSLPITWNRAIGKPKPVFPTSPEKRKKRPNFQSVKGFEAGNRILLVEDNEAAAIQVRKIMESNGYQVDVARGGREALDYVKKSIPDGIILDLMMPEVDGFEVVGQIKKDSKTRHIPVIAMTARVMKSDREKTIEAGCDDYISKPIDPEKFLSKIGKWV